MKTRIIAAITLVSMLLGFAPVVAFAWHGTWSFTENCNSAGTIDVTAFYTQLDSLGGTVEYTSPHLNLHAGDVVTADLVEDHNQSASYTVINVNDCHPPVLPQYCSPGYWKQSQHFHSYVSPFTPTSNANSVFGVSAFPASATLVSVLSTGGGGLAAYGRATVGALLNAAALNSGLTPAQVIAKFNATYAGAPSNPKLLNSYYAGANPEFTAPENCPLN